MNLILVQAFPSNKVLSDGVIKFSEHVGFKTYFIDYPGFDGRNGAYKKLTPGSCISNTQKEIDKLNLDRYILGALSFGCYVINNLQIDERCKLVLNFEPFLGTEYLQTSRMRIHLTSLLCRAIPALGLSDLVFGSKLFGKYLQDSNGKFNNNFAKTVQETIYPNAFFDLAHTILNLEKLPGFLDCHHIIELNCDNNSVINVKKTLKYYEEQVGKENMTVINTPISHSSGTFSYYKRVIKPELVKKLLTVAKKYY